MARQSARPSAVAVAPSSCFGGGYWPQPHPVVAWIRPPSTPLRLITGCAERRLGAPRSSDSRASTCSLWSRPTRA
eukprot:12641013-Alexandrium_andersonii.AAC.1